MNGRKGFGCDPFENNNPGTKGRGVRSCSPKREVILDRIAMDEPAYMTDMTPGTIGGMQVSGIGGNHTKAADQRPTPVPQVQVEAGLTTMTDREAHTVTSESCPGGTKAMRGRSLPCQTDHNSHAHRIPTATETTHGMETMEYNVISFNCHGLKSSFDMILRQMSNISCMFLCETWLRPCDLSVVSNELRNENYWCMMKSSVDPEVTSEGRPYGGVGFICKRITGISYVPINVDNNRICAIKVVSDGKVMLTIIGVYMQCYDGSTNTIQLYSETLEDVQSIIDTNDPSPIMLVGDMNASLPQSDHLDHRWYRNHPFNQHSLLLYDFLLNNELVNGNFAFEQNVNYTYQKNDTKSYIDHVFLSRFAFEQLKNCEILSDLCDNVSDHYPIMSSLSIVFNKITNNKSDYKQAFEHPKIDWTKIKNCKEYKKCLKQLENELISIPVELIEDHDAALKHANNIYDNINAILHKAVEKANNATASNYKGNFKKKHWWNDDCLVSRDRQRFWFKIWVSCDRPREGHIYDCYKLAKKTYRKACRIAINSLSLNKILRLNYYHGHHRTKKFWNLIRKNKCNSNKTSDDINIETLSKYYKNKFNKNDSEPHSFINQAEIVVKDHYLNIKNVIHKEYVMPETTLNNYIKKLRLGCAPGIDGITAEHLKWAAGTKVIESLRLLLTICIRFGIVPDSFASGLLVPLLKKPNSDPTLPNNYRPVVISTTFSKILEIHILKECNDHEFDDLQFGFVQNRGTAMAAALTHDVIEYMKSRGSPVYACSLDAEGAFDGIPHSILFKKALGVIPDTYWRIMVYWYSRLTVQIKWGDGLSHSIKVLKGTRQGGLSSPFLFNLFYQDMIQDLSNMKVGICINDATYNVFCYADDILLCSASVSGLQKLINKANKYIVEHGLRFNPTKTHCITFGKCKTPNKRWFLGGAELKQTESIMYLGVALSDSQKAHVDARIVATRKAFFALKSAGVFANEADVNSRIHIFNAAVRPVILYGLQSVYQNKSSHIKAEKFHAKLLKSTLGLKRYCVNTPLLKAMKVLRVEESVEMQTLQLLRSMILSKSRSHHFYGFLLGQHLNGTATCKTDLLSRSQIICNKYSISLMMMLCNEKYIREKRIFNQFREQDGLVETVRYLTDNLSNESRHLINSLLSPF